MRAAAALTAISLALCAATGARAERLTVAVSSPTVQITSNFTGTDVTVFGVVEGAQEEVLQEGGYQAVVEVVGPQQTVVERRKDNIVGIWANRAGATLVAIPSFYAVNSSVALDAIAPPATLARLGLGFANIQPAAILDATVAEAQEFHDAFVRLQTDAGLYTAGTGVKFLGDTIFRSTTFLPANIPEGKYTVLAYLFSGGTLAAAGQADFTVSKIGVEQTVASFATGQPLVYGLVTVALSIFIGWLGGVIFRRD